MKMYSIFWLIGVSVLILVFYLFYIWYYQSVPQTSINLLKSIPAPQKKDTILIFSPHPDDETIATGGYIKAAFDAGANVWIVLVTDGNKHHLEKIRYNEFSKVTSALGVASNHLIYLNYPDGNLKNANQKEVQDYFKNILTFIRPNIIFVPSDKDIHPDHKTTGLDVESVLPKFKFVSNVYYYLVHYPNFPVPKELKKTLYLTPPLKLLSLSREWLSFPLTSEVESYKFDAIMMYKTQLVFPPLKELIEGFVRRNELFFIIK